jgi:hypothetical protein
MVIVVKRRGDGNSSIVDRIILHVRYIGATGCLNTVNTIVLFGIVRCSVC